MTNFDELKEKARKVAGATVDAAKQLALVSKCRVQITAEQEKIRSLYAKLGKLYYKDYVTDEEPDEAEYEPLCDQISAHYRKISQLRDMMEEAKNNYDTVKKDCKTAKAQKDAEEDRIIDIVTNQPETPSVEEDELLDELNTLTDQSPYGEILE
jgi:hypothetical protein